MSYNIKTISVFEKQAKKLIKKYPSLKDELYVLVESLKTEPMQGVLVANNCYKIRLAIASKLKGKSGGARVITHVKVVDNNVFLISIYDKSEQENISDSSIKKLVLMIK